ncbi:MULTISPECIES: hypothetical protein [unclassified Dehalobacter]|uniref:hypothetical protein n=1 Tax=unclassified Dehalobacter TaxID=2635733 RepID=UPI000E6C126E|nr:MULTISPECIES: hypothetical protein [unclassified Dehalobacter]RJE48465.1 hypothetical protein A7K50_11345 [Dehalobacter sp. MCB1]TCX50534.1 hypothetical protein C1I36_08240 [Dehalobacter sp. 14DCB1]TCX52226.1 hypothetical protein C1I38_09490 [Dehalobacter sp. 12DCB1]
MQHSQSEIKKILDQGMITRSLVESEVSMRKCEMYSEMANDKEVKAFFKDQASALDGLSNFLKSKLAQVM